MASRSPRAQVSVGKPAKALTGSLAECVEIRVGDYRAGYIQFVAKPGILLCIGGSIEAPVIQPAGKRGKAAKAAKAAEGEAEAAESAEGEGAVPDESALASIQHGQVRATQALLGAQATVRFGAASTAILDGGTEVAVGITWEQAFRRAATDAGLFQSGCSVLARDRGTDVFIPADRLTRDGAAKMQDTVMQEQIAFGDDPQAEPIDGFTFSA